MSNVYYGAESLLDNLGSTAALGLTVNFLSLALSVAVYVLTAIALYTMAKRRGIRHAWLSWVPVGDMWILGSLSDQYRYVAKGQEKNKRKILLILNLLTLAVLMGFLVCMFLIAGNMVQAEVLGYGDAQMTASVLRPALIAMGLVLPGLGVTIAAAVFQYMALYDVYQSADPEQSVLFLVLSILVSITQPILLFILRKKDLGMVRQIPRNDSDYRQPRNPEPQGLPESWQQDQQ